MKRAAKTKRWRGGALLIALLVLPSAPAVADGYDEILAMLQGGLSEATILEWLAAGEAVLGRPSAEEMIALKEAGASEDLLLELLRRSRQPPPEATQAAVPAPVDAPAPVAEPEPAPMPPPPAGASPPLPVAPVAATPAAPAAEAAEEGRVPVRFRLLYAPRFDEDEEPWDLLVYLDGQPLSFVPEGGDPLGVTAGEPLEVEIELAAGRHTLRLIQERHRRVRRGWRHAARPGPQAFTFELAAAPAARVEAEFRQGWGDLRDPLTFRLIQGDRVADLEEVGGDPDSWPELCEDAGAKADAGCVAWDSLWPGSAPPRAEVLEALARFDFRPVPR